MPYPIYLAQPNINTCPTEINSCKTLRASYVICNTQWRQRSVHIYFLLSDEVHIAQHHNPNLKPHQQKPATRNQILKFNLFPLPLSCRTCFRLSFVNSQSTTQVKRKQITCKNSILLPNKNDYFYGSLILYIRSFFPLSLSFSFSAIFSVNYFFFLRASTQSQSKSIHYKTLIYIFSKLAHSPKTSLQFLTVINKEVNDLSFSFLPSQFTQ